MQPTGKIDCLSELRVEIGGRIGAGFVRGLETTLTFDETQFVGSGMYLFACVLERFLALYTSLNSFNQLAIRTEQREGIIKRFPPRAGEQELLAVPDRVRLGR